MDILKKLFPLSFKTMKEVKDLVIGIVVYLIVAILAGVAIFLATLITGWIPGVGALVGWVLGLAGGLIDLYALVGIILQILVYTKVIKD
ncbi:MAG: hypothetical protein IKA76_08540 [Clostridia bacterium]|nr:hypothetical protein [Clostridia bacterium]